MIPRCGHRAALSALRSSAAIRLSATRCLAPVAATAAHARPLSATASPTSPEPLRLLRFVDPAGEEHFGSFVDATETHARIALRSASSGRMDLTQVVKTVDLLLPPVDPPAIFAIGLNYADHAKEVRRVSTDGRAAMHSNRRLGCKIPIASGAAYTTALTL